MAEAGRPSEYIPEIGDKICARIAEGDAIRTICKDDDMPAVSTFYRWLRQNEQLRKQYAQAKTDCCEALFDEMFDIADNAGNDWMEGNDEDNPGWRFNGDHVQRSRLRVDIRKWALSKLMPKKYGEKLDVTSDGDKLPAVPGVLMVQFVEPKADAAD